MISARQPACVENIKNKQLAATAAAYHKQRENINGERKACENIGVSNESIISA